MEVGVSDVGNPLDGLSALHDHLHGLTGIKISSVVFRHGIQKRVYAITGVRELWVSTPNRCCYNSLLC